MLQVVIHTQRQPIGKQFLDHRLRSGQSKKQIWYLAQHFTNNNNYTVRQRDNVEGDEGNSGRDALHFHTLHDMQAQVREIFFYFCLLLRYGFMNV